MSTCLEQSQTSLLSHPRLAGVRACPEMALVKSENLSDQVRVKFRATTSLQPQDAWIWYDETAKGIQVQFLKSAPSVELTILRLKDISSVKAKSFIQGSEFIFVVAIVLKSAAGQTFLQFGKREDRDTWDSGLRYLVVAREQLDAGTEVEVPDGEYHPIRHIVLKAPKAGVVVAMSVDVKGEEQELQVLADQTSSSECKNLVVDFVQKHRIMPSETTSLYRFVRSLVQRALMESQTAALIDEINAQHFERVLQVRGPTASSTALLNGARDKLDRLSRDIQERIGYQGTGALIVTEILHRNMDKLRLINDLCARIYDLECAAPSKHSV